MRKIDGFQRCSTGRVLERRTGSKRFDGQDGGTEATGTAWLSIVRSAHAFLTFSQQTVCRERKMTQPRTARKETTRTNRVSVRHWHGRLRAVPLSMPAAPTRCRVRMLARYVLPPLGYTIFILTPSFDSPPLPHSTRPFTRRNRLLRSLPSPVKG